MDAQQQAAGQGGSANDAQALPAWAAREVAQHPEWSMRFEGDELAGYLLGERVAAMGAEQARAGSFFPRMQMMRAMLSATLVHMGVTPDQGDGRPDTSVQEAKARREARDRVRDGALRSLREAVRSAEQQGAAQTLGKLRQVLSMVERRHAGPAAARRAAERADAMIAAELRKEAGQGQTSFFFGSVN